MEGSGRREGDGKEGGREKNEVRWEETGRRDKGEGEKK